MKRLLLIATLALTTAFSPVKECGSTAAADTDPFDACDPIRGFNESVFSFNLGADEWVIAPVAHTYHELPEASRNIIDSILTNLAEPANVLNSTLQGDLQTAGTSLWRFILNTTFGLGGIHDFAGENGLKYSEQHFNNTLASYGMPEGAYIVLPILGPSSTRDTVGKVVDWFTDPVGWYLTTPQSIAQTVVDGVNTRDQNDAIINQFYYESIDPYTASRAAFLQHQSLK